MTHSSGVSMSGVFNPSRLTGISAPALCRRMRMSAVSEHSSPVPLISPSDWAKWPSPMDSNAPSTETGR